MFESVEFPSEGATLRGRLYRPQQAGRAPVVVMAHGITATITMVADRYADVFHDAGFAVLLYDHRNFGSSGGEPRLEINPWVQARGYRAALGFIESIPDVDHDRIALWGDSYSGPEAMIVGAIDDRPAAVVVQVPAIGAEPPPPDPDGSLFAAVVDALDHGDLSGGPEHTTGPLPVVSPDQGSMASLLKPIQAYRWFTDYGGRPGSKWENRTTRVLPPTPCPFHAGIAAPHLRAPLLMMVAPDDEMVGANPEIARAAFEEVPAPKTLVEIEGGHFGLLYEPSPEFDHATRTQRDFLLRWLT